MTVLHFIAQSLSLSSSHCLDELNNVKSGIKKTKKHHYHLLFMQLFLKLFSGMTNIVDPDQTAPSGSASALFAFDVLSENFPAGT